MNHNEHTNTVSDYHKRAHIPSGWSVAAKILIIMIASLLILSLRASITRADDPPVKPVIYLPIVAQPSKPPKPLPDDWEKAIKEIVNRAAKLPPLDEERDETLDKVTIKPPDDDYQYTYEKHDVVENIKSVYNLGLNDDIIWPGSLIRGDRAHDFVYQPIVIPRGPMVLSVDLATADCEASDISVTVVDPKLSTVRQGISDLLKKNILPQCKEIAARSYFDKEEVYSKSHMNLAVNADASFGSFDLSSEFNWDETNTKSKIVVRYQQIFYTIDMDTPANHAALFDRSRTSVAEIAEAMPPGSMPMYVASVKYGMIAFMLIETEESAEQMKAALEAKYSDHTSEVYVRGELTIEEALQTSKTKTIIYGGGTGGIAGTFDGVDGLIELIRINNENKYFKPGESAVPPGLPLVYKFRHLKDNTMGLITLTSQYTLVRPLQRYKRYEIEIEKFADTLCDDGSGEKACEVRELKIFVRACNRQELGGSDCAQLANPPDGKGQEILHEYVSKATNFENGAEWPINERGYVTFQTDLYNFAAATMEFTGEVWEEDTGYYELSDGKLNLPSKSFDEKDKKLAIEYAHNPSGEYVFGNFYFNLEDMSARGNPNPPPSPFVGTPVSYESYNKPDHYMYDDVFKLMLEQNDGTPAFARYATFKKKAGLANPGNDEMVSFESVANPGYYLLRYLYVEGASPLICCKLRLDRYEHTTQFLQAATFRMVPGLAANDDDLFSLMAFSDLPNYYIYHRNGELFLHPYDRNDSNFAADATFKEVEGLAK